MVESEIQKVYHWDQSKGLFVWAGAFELLEKLIDSYLKY
jgi:hypothetical protein